MPQKKSYSIGVPKITLEESGRLVSEEFDDVYYSIRDGLEETRYVFLTHNDLETRWQELDSFKIVEFGFGTGLNFLATWDLWKKTAHCKLEYISIEKYPISKDALRGILERWVELGDLSEQLLQVYPDCNPGQHVLKFESEMLTLTLIFADVVECLDLIPNSVDAWYLDGFDPKKNPDMWSEEVYVAIGEKSIVGSTIATFTAAGIVKRALRASGFKLKRVDGFGPKWHMLKGVFQGVSE